MEEIANILQNVMASYGFWGCVFVVCILIASQLIKWPLKKIAIKFTETKGKDKVSITAWFYFLPVALSFVFTFVFYSWKYIGWNMESFDWGKYFSLVTALASIAEALYSGIEIFWKKWLAYYKSKAEKAVENKDSLSKAEYVATEKILYKGIEYSGVGKATAEGKTLEKATEKARKLAVKEAKANALHEAKRAIAVKKAEEALEAAKKS